MNRRARSARRQPRVETLEARSLLSVDARGLVPPTTGTPASLFVRFAPNASSKDQKASLAAVRATVITAYPDGPELVTLGKGGRLDEAIARLRANPKVLYAQADRTIHVDAVPVYPNDPAFGRLWGLNNPINNVDIDAPEAWGITTGSPSTIVAVIDTGVDLGNPDFAGRIWTNPVNGASAGFPNDLHGWNFLAHNNNVQDNNGHGTHVASTIAATANNAYGVAGVASTVRIMPLKFLDSKGNGSTTDAVAAIYYAVNHGARVINASWGGVDYSGPLRDAIAYANTHNVVFVTAAGNNGTNNDFFASFPASFRLPNELSVASVDRNGGLPSFSNYGGSTVDLAAPGVDIVGDVPLSIDASGYQTLSGTSMSTAYVSGVAALVAGVDPQFSAAQIVQRIDATTKPLLSLTGKTISGGMVDAYGAVAANVVSISATTTLSGIPSLVAGASTVADVQASILASDEYFALHGGTAQGFISGLFLNLLDRFPDPTGLQQWVGVYGSPNVTRFEVAKAILTSPEGRLTEVAHWFRDDLGRTSTIDALKANPGVAAWANLISIGFGDDTVRAAIMSSPEYLIGHGASPPSVIRGYYTDLYDREPDIAGGSAWAGLLWAGYAPFTVLRYFQGTPEAHQTQVARWFIEDLGRPTSVAALKANPGVQAWAAALGNL